MTGDAGLLFMFFLFFGGGFLTCYFSEGGSRVKQGRSAIRGFGFRVGRE